MKRRLVEDLRDPGTGQPLALVTGAEEGEVREGTLRAASGAEYPVRGGIPWFAPPEAQEPGQRETVESFSFKWSRAREYRGATLGHYTQWYLDRYGFGAEEGLRRFLEPKRRILDAGTAHGRDAAMYARLSAAEVYGVDISTGIENAYRDLGTVPRLHFLQADIGRLPFATGFFDLIACDQVLHHTPDTRAALQRLVERLAPGGHVLFYVYKRKGPIREFCDDYIRERTTRMSPEECLRFSEAITHLGKALTELKAEIEVPADIPLLGIKAGRHDVQRFFYWNVLKCYWNDGMDWESNVITNFDWYHPVHAHRHTVDEVRQWCAAEGLSVEHFDVQESGISVRARKPR
jgi:SAM-dependent methyltransferase